MAAISTHKSQSYLKSTAVRTGVRGTPTLARIPTGAKFSIFSAKNKNHALAARGDGNLAGRVKVQAKGVSLIPKNYSAVMPAGDFVLAKFQK
eukprot:1392056-Amorphochlora_amoeboformis.AAC.1